MSVTTGNAEERTQAATLALMRKTAAGTLNLDAPESFPQAIAPNVFWLGNCLKKETPTGEVHTGVWAYLIVGTDKAMLFDTGSPQGWAVMSDQIARCLAGRKLDYVMPSHPEIPHAGNLASILDAYPEAQALVDRRDYHLHFPEQADRLQVCRVGDQLDLGGGYVFRVVNAVLRDMPNTFWGYEEFSRVLFVGDGFAYLHSPDASDEEVGTHLPGQCGRVSGMGDPFPSLEDIQYYCSMAFYWSRYRDNADSTFDLLQQVMRECPTDILAPSHGNVSLDIKRVVPLAREAHRKAYRG